MTPTMKVRRLTPTATLQAYVRPAAIFRDYVVPSSVDESLGRGGIAALTAPGPAGATNAAPEGGRCGADEIARPAPSCDGGCAPRVCECGREGDG